MVIYLIKVIVFYTLILNINCYQINEYIQNDNITNKGVLINSDTRVYHIHYIRTNFIKIAHYSNLLKPSASSKYYNSYQSGLKTLLLKILIIVDYKMYQIHQNNLTVLYDHVISRWDDVDNCFNLLLWPKIKLLLTGIVVPMHPDIFEQPIEIKDRKGYYYPFNLTLNKMQVWLNNNTDQFEGFDCDIFFYMSQSFLVNDNYSQNDFYTVDGMMNQFHCPYSQGPNEISGGILYDNENFGITTARIITTGFGIPYDEEAGCESRFIMGIFLTQVSNSWSRCSKKKFKAIFRDKKFSCFKMVRYLSQQNDDTYNQ